VRLRGKMYLMIGLLLMGVSFIDGALSL